MRNLCLTLCLITFGSTTAMAQLIGGPIARTAAELTPQARHVAGFVGTVSDGPTFIGGRFAYALNSNMEVFGDLERMTDYISDMNGDFGATAVQVGATYNLPIEAPFDLAVRGALFKPFIGSETVGSESVNEPGVMATASAEVDVSAIGLGICGIASRDLAEMTGVDGLSAYVAAGINWVRTEVEWSWNASGTVDLGFGLGGMTTSTGGSESDSSTDTEIGIAVGGILDISENLSVFAELAHVDNVVAAAGGVWNF